MKLSLEVLEHGSTQKRVKGESVEGFLSKVTHIAIYGKLVEKMEHFCHCKNLCVLYLYDNKITTIEGISECSNLERLYLQNNEITEISGLENGLSKLKILHLSNNRISKLTNLFNLTSLENLYLDHQRIGNMSLELEEKCLESLGPTLKILKLANNNIKHILPIAHCELVTELGLDNNNIQDWKELSMVLQFCTNLTKLDIFQNPVAQGIKFRQRVILQSPNLATIGDKVINETERIFLQNMEFVQQQNRKRQLENESKTISRRESEENMLANHQDIIDAVWKPIPHMPPYASQYRDLMVHQIASAQQPKSLGSTRWSSALSLGSNKSTTERRKSEPKIPAAAEKSYLYNMQRKHNLSSETLDVSGIAALGRGI